MEPCNIDVGTARLVQRSPPLGANAGDENFKFASINDTRFNFGWERWKFISRDVQIPARPEEAAVGEGLRRTIEEIVRRAAQFSDLCAAVALKIESSRTTG